jgi:hypothetical protein
VTITVAKGRAEEGGLLPKIRIQLPQPLGAAIFLAVAGLLLYWIWTHTGSTGELNPTSRARILFPVWGNTALDTTGRVWARAGDVILVDYDVRLEAGFFSVTVGKTRWPSRRLLRHEESRALRRSTSGQLRYVVKQTGFHAIRAGRYSVWRGEAHVRWMRIRRE